MSNRGAEAYSQAYEYVCKGSPGLSPKEQRRLAMQYLNMTATPPLTWRELWAARKRRSELRKQNIPGKP